MGCNMVATTTRSAFDRQLGSLLHDVLALSEMVDTQLQDALKALDTYDSVLAQRVSDYDSTVNSLRYEIEEQAYTLLALQQPNARDLRRIVAAVSIVTNLERMGDHAAGIARLVMRMTEAGCALSCAKFTEMGKLSVRMLHDAMTALSEQDATLARDVINRDDEVDVLHKAAYDELIALMTVADSAAVIECATMLMWCSHNLERYADRVSNICDRVLYLITGNLHEPRMDSMP
jgi:phosphate transport system protein